MDKTPSSPTPSTGSASDTPDSQPSTVAEPPVPPTPRWAVTALAGFAFLGMIAVLTIILSDTLEDPARPAIVAALGALGGFLGYIQSFCRYVGERKFQISWFLYYLLYPLKGAGLSLIVFLFLKTGIVTINVGEASATGELGTSVYYFIGGLSGMFSNQAIQMLSEVFNIVFKSVEGKQSLKEKDS